MRIKQVGERLIHSHQEWRDYIVRQQEVIKMNKSIMPMIDNLKSKLDSISNQYLGEKGLYFEMEKIRNKTTELKVSMLRFLNLKQFTK
jgi:hypothetical protein